MLKIKISMAMVFQTGMIVTWMLMVRQTHFLNDQTDLPMMLLRLIMPMISVHEVVVQETKVDQLDEINLQVLVDEVEVDEVEVEVDEVEAEADEVERMLDSLLVVVDDELLDDEISHQVEGDQLMDNLLEVHEMDEINHEDKMMMHEMVVQATQLHEMVVRDLRVKEILVQVALMADDLHKGDLQPTEMHLKVGMILVVLDDKPLPDQQLVLAVVVVVVIMMVMMVQDSKTEVVEKVQIKIGMVMVFQTEKILIPMVEVSRL